MKEDLYACVLPSPLGRLGVRMGDDTLQAIDYLGRDVLLKPARSAAARRVAGVLEAYFQDGRSVLELPPLDLRGTPYQQRVWRAIATIPAGTTRTYGEVAEMIGSGPRAVGGACRENPVPILIPCHRVVGKHDGGGYSGHRQGPMMARKQWLLAHEGLIRPLPIAL